MLVEADDQHAVAWTRPDDWKFDPDHPKQGLLGQFKGGFHVAMCDGSVRFLPQASTNRCSRECSPKPAANRGIIPDRREQLLTIRETLAPRQLSFSA